MIVDGKLVCNWCHRVITNSHHLAVKQIGSGGKVNDYRHYHFRHPADCWYLFCRLAKANPK